MSNENVGSVWRDARRGRYSPEELSVYLREAEEIEKLRSLADFIEHRKGELMFAHVHLGEISYDLSDKDRGCLARSVRHVATAKEKRLPFDVREEYAIGGEE